MKQFLMADIVRALQNSGLLRSKTINGGKQVIQYWLRTGVLKLRKMTNGYYVVGEDEMKKMIRSLRDYGYYSFDE